MRTIGKSNEIYDAFTQYLERYESKPEQEFILEVKVKRKIRTLASNRYYWAILTLLEEESEAGYTKDEWHDIFKGMFLTRVEQAFGKEFIKMGSTAKLVTTSFNMYLDKIKDFVLSNHILEIFPEPEDHNFMKWCEERGL